MSSKNQFEFTKKNIDNYLKEVAKEYRKQIGKNMPAEIVIIGGASLLINYRFRAMTTDIDAVIQAASVMQDVINSVGDRYDLPRGWLNQDFKRTSSYSPNIVRFSQYYKTYSNVLTVRTVAAEYLIAMKLRSGRQYKHDFSDVLGILSEHKNSGKPITLEQIQSAVFDLYGSWDALSPDSQNFIVNVISDGRFEELFEQTAIGEHEIREQLIGFEKQNPGVVKAENVNEIAEELQMGHNRASVLLELRKIKKELSDEKVGEYKALEEHER